MGKSELVAAQIEPAFEVSEAVGFTSITSAVLNFYVVGMAHALASSAMLSFELYPWHSARLTSSIRPGPEIIEQFVWEPLAEISNAPAFAFGAAWFPILEGHLGLSVVARLRSGGDDDGSHVPSRTGACPAVAGWRTRRCRQTVRVRRPPVS